MGLLETRYRRAFRPHEGGYLFRQWGTDVRFEADEVEALVAAWRVVWVNPLFWAGYVLFGLVLPGLLVVQDYPVAALMLSLLTALFAIVALVHVWRRRNGDAALRVPIGAERPSPFSPIWRAVCAIAFVAYLQSELLEFRLWIHSIGSYLLPLLVGRLGIALLAWWRIGRGQADPLDSPVFVAICRIAIVLMLSAGAASQFLNPTAGWSDYGVGALAVLAALWVLAKLVRGRPVQQDRNGLLLVM